MKQAHQWAPRFWVLRRATKSRGNSERPSRTEREVVLKCLRGLRSAPKQRGSSVDAAGESDRDPVSGKRGDYRTLIAQPKQTPLGAPRAPAIGDTRNRLPSFSRGPIQSLPEARQFAGKLRDECIDPSGLLETIASDGKAQIGGSVFLQKEPGIAAVELVELDHAA